MTKNLMCPLPKTMGSTTRTNDFNYIEILNEFQQAMQKNHCFCNTQIVADGQIHRFHIQGNKPGSKNGWYVLHLYPILCGVFGDWKNDIKISWKHQQYYSLPPQQKAEIDAQIKAKQLEQECLQQEERQKAKKTAEQLWEKARLAVINHSYLMLKQVKAYGIKQGRRSLIVPIFNSKNEIQSLQFIDEKGRKKFLPGSELKGNYFVIGEITNKIFICEGYATSATIYEATCCYTIVAFNAGNLLPVAQQIKAQYPNHEIIIVADNDQWTVGNPGVAKATAAVNAIDAQLAVPSFIDLDINKKPTDFNDLKVLAGIEVVRKQLTQLQASTLPIDATAKKPSNFEKAIKLLDNSEFFHDEYKGSYVTVKNSDHFVTFMLDNEDFKNYLSHLYWQTYKQALSKNILLEIIDTLKGRALYAGECQKVFTRVGIVNGDIYINLASSKHEIVKISSCGWEIITGSSIKFRSTSTMQALPTPQRGGDFNKLWDFVNIPNEKNRQLVLVWILECLRPTTNFPILVLQGMQGSAKSTTQNMLRRLIDPSNTNLRMAPRKSEDLLINARNNWLVSYNNLSHLTVQQQDDLCCLSTGGGFSTRKLFTTAEEESSDIKRPVVLNGIGDLVTRQDLIDRSIIVELPAIPNKNRKTEQEIEHAFQQAAPQIFGGLLTLLSKALSALPQIQLAEKPRMADFALLGTAVERVANWPTGSFLKAYQDTKIESVITTLEHSPVALAIIPFIEKRHFFNGTCRQLWQSLEVFRPERMKWPKSPRGLAIELKRHISALALLGINVLFNPQRQKDGYQVKLEKQQDQ